MSAALDLADEVPDVAGTIEAWRAWLVLPRDGGFSLAGVVYKVCWPAGEPLVATCLRHAGRLLARLRGRWPHDPPALTCTCGAYATDLERVRSYLEPELGDTRVRAFGSVALWGDVVECENGWRASRAYPTRLWVATAGSRSRSGAARVAEGLASYGVPVELVDGEWSDAMSAAALAKP